MSEKTFATGPGGQQIKTPGWFSWRHSTREEHDAAREKWIAAHPFSIAARKRRGKNS